ncbi:MAG: DNA polymerase III subunit delta [Chitinophagaceae bacterium]|jgi:DNA polymerase-3 subunit delta|nr:DNA polymerase III subunit delta [Chitinophagaceae bacterium]MBK8299249.1 DNA polymerase III subunit delta [Chitinophagaceae bacterium]MBK9463302.1 DNA polymerase III subunit delta [Chitinophagaceae bacterium]MBK9659571.1 DNA polymerase III subunit delta [Chitinophagaceae bacterium]MBK9936893.1 DNA polymerase III subunit delta [Chitinophagaceae bacterium]
MSVEKIITDWKKKNFKPVYWLEGEEEYFIDKAIDYAEHHILNESEASFNLSVFYGKDASWPDVVNACSRYPMFAERQVVLLKEAQQMKDVEKLESYIENPLSSTVFVVSYKEKKLDARKKFAKLVKEKGVLLTTKKMYDRELPEWTQELLRSKGLTISPKGLALLVDHIGNDLVRIENEIDKLSVNLGKRTAISEEDIEQYIGVSKDYNVFELQSALASKDLSRSIRIIQYFEANPKAGPIQLVLPSLYSFFSKVFMVFGAGTSDEKTIATTIGVNPYFMKDYMQAARLYTYPGVEKILLLLHQYNLKSVGVGSTNTDDASLLKEMVVKMMS